MRLFVVTILLCTIALATACTDDEVPVYVEPETVQATAPVEAEPEVAESPEVEPEPEPAAAQEAEPERDQVVVFRLTDNLDIYQWPGNDWQPFLSHRAGTLLLANGRARPENGELWLRLDMNNNVEGWVRERETPLSLDEARMLPWVLAPEFPTAELDVPGGETITVSLLGQSADEQQLAVLLPGSDQPLWVSTSDLSLDRNWYWLPVYEGFVFGEWRPTRDQPLVVVEAHYWAEIYARPNGDPSGFRIFQVNQNWGNMPPKQYAVLGRSLDEAWLAIRMDDFVPPVGWIQLDSVNLNVDPTTLPYMLNGETELLPITNVPITNESIANEVQTGDGQVPTALRLYHWQWRADGVLIGSNDGLWRWDPAVDAEPVQFAPPQWVVFSPDGRFAASGTPPDYESGDLTRDITITEVDSGESVTFVDAGAAYFTHHDADPSLIWSPDSQFLLVWYNSYDENDWSGANVLSLDGTVTRFDSALTGSFRRWLSGNSLLMQTADGYAVYSANGELLREPTNLPDSYTYVDQTRSLHWDPSEPGWTITDWTTSESTSLPAPLNQPKWRDSGSHGPVFRIDGHLVHFATVSDGVASTVVYDAERHFIVEFADVSVSMDDTDYLVRSYQWSADGQRVAVVFADAQGFHFDLTTGTASQLPLPVPENDDRRFYDWNMIVDWSPDGRLLLTQSTYRTNEYDEDGVAIYPPRPGYITPPWPLNSEYRLIDIETGRIVARFRGNPDQCWSAGHTAAFSPDGQWLAFSGEDNDCT